MGESSVSKQSDGPKIPYRNPVTHLLRDRFLVHLGVVHHKSTRRGQLLIARGALEMFRLLMLDQHLFVLEYSVAIVAPCLFLVLHRALLLFLSHYSVPRWIRGFTLHFSGTTAVCHFAC